jgi:AcrR family transcriptional regulator
MHTRGLARSTTKEIAKAAGFSEASLYKHFQDKTDLFIAVLTERVPSSLGALLADLTPGEGTVADTLTRVARGAMEFYATTFPIAASVFSEPSLLAAHRAALRERGAGPQKVNTLLAAYLAGERELGRVDAAADPYASAALLLGACLQHAFLAHFDEVEPADQFAATLVRTLLAGVC